MPIKSPTDHMLHPGQVLAEIYMKDRDYNQSTLAEDLGCQPRKINEIVNGKRGITAEFALQLADLFDTTPEMWVRMQADYDLFVAIKKLAGTNKPSKKKKTTKKAISSHSSPAPRKMPMGN
jgi:addiction module HigA family antidote